MLIRFMTRTGYLLGFLVCIGLLGFGLYLQHFDNQEPCPLCILQRVAFMALGIIFLIAAIHNPKKLGAAIYALLITIAAAIGAAIAARQVWLQHLPKDKIPQCGPGLEYMLEQFPLSKALSMILRGSGECAEVGWMFLGLTIAGWALVFFIALGLWGIILAAHRRK